MSPAVVSAVGRGAELADSLSGELQIQRKAVPSGPHFGQYTTSKTHNAFCLLGQHASNTESRLGCPIATKPVYISGAESVCTAEV